MPSLEPSLTTTISSSTPSWLVRESRVAVRLEAPFRTPITTDTTGAAPGSCSTDSWLISGHVPPCSRIRPQTCPESHAQTGRPAPAQRAGQQAVEKELQPAAGPPGSDPPGEQEQLPRGRLRSSGAALAAEQEGGSGEASHLRPPAVDPGRQGAAQQGLTGPGPIRQLAGVQVAPVAEVIVAHVDAPHGDLARHPGQGDPVAPALPSYSQSSSLIQLCQGPMRSSRERR